MHRTPSPISLGRWVLLLMALAPPLCAQTKDICLPEAWGVPNLNGLPMNNGPIWWGTSATIMTRLDDPRWRGAVSEDHNGEATFRALHRTGVSTDTLFLSWTVKIDNYPLDVASLSANPPSGDQLVIGFKQKSDKAIIIHLGLGATSLGDATDYAARKVYTWDETTLTGISVPQWIVDATRTWISVDVNNKPQWTIQMVVPISAAGIGTGINLDLGSKQSQMFYALLVKWPGSYVEYNWGTASAIRDNGLNTVSYPDTTPVWGKVSWGTSSNCAGDVALDANQIGVDIGTSALDYQIKVKYPPDHNDVQNKVTARPRNISATDIAAGRIQGDFYLSNYGSQIMDPTLPGSFWQKISPVPPTSTAITAGDLGFIQIAPPFIVDDAVRCLYIDDMSVCNPAGIRDQCILVQLSEVTPASPSPGPLQPTLVFRNQSAYMNMTFTKASTLRHRAQISVGGLKPLDDGRTTRDVYLYVETVNMPARTSGDSKSGVTMARDTLIVAHRDTALNLEWGIIRLARGDSLRIPVRHTLLAAGASARERFATVKRAAATGNLTVSETDAAVPTYRIHAFHATGDSLGKYPILEPQTSFGYWVEHDGEVIGWRHRMEGEHLVRLAPNYYKIEVPNNGRAIITTVIEALEWRPFALSLHGGVSLPSGSFKTTNDPGFGIIGDAEYWLNRRFALEGLFGYHRFGGKGANPDLELRHLSAGFEVRVTPGNPSLLADVGYGTYTFKPEGMDWGAHAGLGLEFKVTPTLSLGVTGRFHTVSTPGSRTTFYSVQAGGWIRL